MQAMGDAIDTLVDVTIHYPGGIPTMIDLLCGRVSRVCVRIHASPIPADLRSGNYEDDADYRARFQSWVNGLWIAKDRELSAMRSG